VNRWHYYLTILLIAVTPSALGQDEATYLDVSLAIFDMNLPQDSLVQQQEDIYPAVRQAEARYLPSFLKIMLEESGHWGAVRLLPEQDTGAELQISGKIITSNGRSLVIEIQAVDATGRLWIDRTFSREAVETVSLNQVLGTDAFQYLYSDIASELAEYKATLSAQQITEIKQVAELRYALALAPDVFNEFLGNDDSGHYHLLRLPADNDPFLARIREIREHEYVFIDVVDEQYESFFVSIKPVYDLWSQYRRDQMASEADKIRRETQQGTQFRRGSYMSLRESYNNYRWSRMQDQYLDELNEGFTNEVLPTDITLEDSLYQLSGTLEEQYQEWRDILKALYQLDNPTGN